MNVKLAVRLLAICAVAIGPLAACSSSGNSGSGTSTASRGSARGTGKTIAVLYAFSSSAYIQNVVKGIDQQAKANGYKVKHLGIASGSPQAEFANIQDTATQNAYDGYVIVPVNSVADIPAAKQLIATGKPVVTASLALGRDLCTEKPQLEGMAASALTPTCETGKGFGQLTQQACKGLSACHVLWVTGLGIPAELEMKAGLQEAVKAIPNATLTSSSPTQYDLNTSINVLTDTLQANRSINVVVTNVEEEFQGLLKAETAAGRSDIRGISNGCEADQRAAIKAGRLFGCTLSSGLPISDGKLAMDAMVKALQSKSNWGVGVNTLKTRGYPPTLTKANESTWASIPIESA